jgi:hypothetical protein
VRLLAVLLLAPLLIAPAAAQAAPALDVQLAKPSVRFGAAHSLTGTLADGSAPLAAQEVVLEGRRFPYHGGYRVISRTVTDAAGAFAFKPVLDRNHQLRVVATAQALVSRPLRAYTLPSFELSFRALEPGVVRLYQRYTVPKTVKLGSPTLFYLGARGKKVASKRVSAVTKRTSAGHYTAIATVTLPRGWHGSFRYGSCFRTTLGSGMGDPSASCPKLSLRF